MISLGLFSVIPSMQLSLCSRGWTPAVELLKVQAEESSQGSVLGDALPSLLGRLSTALTRGKKSANRTAPGAGKAKTSGDSRTNNRQSPATQIPPRSKLPKAPSGVNTSYSGFTLAIFAGHNMAVSISLLGLKSNVTSSESPLSLQPVMSPACITC